MKGRKCVALRGSASLLFLSIILPLFLLMLVVSFELNVFFQHRESVQRIADGVARELLRGSLSRTEVVATIRRQLQAEKPFISLASVVVSKDTRRASLEVDSIFRPTIAKILAAYTLSSTGDIPFRVTSRVQRPPFGATIILDLSVPLTEDPCISTELLAQKEFVQKLLHTISYYGGEAPGVVLLGGRSKLTVRLPINGEPSEVEFCNSDTPRSVDGQLRLVKGIAAPPEDTDVVSDGVLEAIVEDMNRARVGRHIVVMMTRGFDARWSGVSQVASALREVSMSTGVLLSSSHLVTDSFEGRGLCDGERKVRGTQLFRSHCIEISSARHLDAEFVVALLGDVSAAILE